MDEFVFLDTETTGNDPVKDRLFQVCYKHKGKCHTEYFKPPIPISIKSQSITHVTNKMVEDKKPFSESPMKEALSLLLQNHILVAHNAAFDTAMLSQEGIETPRFICTLKVARALDTNCVIPEYNLQYLRYYLELDVKAHAHEAQDDVLVLEALFDRLMSKMLTKFESTQAAIDEMMRISKEPFLLPMLTFGKHRGKRIDEVVQTDRSYLEWLLNQKMQNNNGQEEDWIYTLQYHLNTQSESVREN